jgi:hypothetical protein
MDGGLEAQKRQLAPVEVSYSKETGEYNGIIE